MIPESQGISLGLEDPPEEEVAIHSSILTRRIPWTESLVGYSLWGCRVGRDWATEHTRRAEHIFTEHIATRAYFLSVSLWLLWVQPFCPFSQGCFIFTRLFHIIEFWEFLRFSKYILSMCCKYFPSTYNFIFSFSQQCFKFSQSPI